MIAALGLGDIHEGKRLEQQIAKGRLDFILQQAQRLGLAAVADDIRRAAADAEDILSRRAAS